MRKKYNTEEERKEARYRDNKKWRMANNIKVKELNSKNQNSCFYVYTHTNSKGDLYIGSGTKYRPYQKKEGNRSKHWLASFQNDLTVKIIREFKTKEEARFLESNMIRAIGLNNLVNQYK